MSNWELEMIFYFILELIINKSLWAPGSRFNPELGLAFVWSFARSTMSIKVFFGFSS